LLNYYLGQFGNFSVTLKTKRNGKIFYVRQAGVF
ncbi:hypothetical protein chiPu_0017715, partial [Chiloscyllium punctatum]|nr:hypothetical protein [Chiloscyllium punctatum]